jgi:hypothetical protein
LCHTDSQYRCLSTSGPSLFWPSRFQSPGENWQSKACFTAGTLLAVEGGYKAIEEIRAGEQVYSRDQ